MERRPARAWLVLGSNLGSPPQNVRRALRALRRLPATLLLKTSRLLRTSPVDRLRQPDFVNCGALLSTRLSPMGLLTELKRLEALAGRRPGRRWGPRPLDIDIIFYGGRRARWRFLTLPHPQALERRFVLAALAELSPGLRPPGQSRTVTQLLAALKAPSQRVGPID
ncbi:MAG: 2-amino-4-hydroxy-6-hydroxymethyldihydropteridine diphosphokinase [Elusimicrobia bacterium]|nr:2-amino-4-hydroxy-6-hydroxymethyldihydropteridine diphosphokinase [Elusimicrobiota bacterium]